MKTVEFSSMVNCGVEFMKSLTQLYGPEKGMELWEGICKSLDKEVYGAIFFRMVTSEQNYKLTFTYPRPVTSMAQASVAIPVIKAIRNATSMALKDAIDLWDNSASGPVTVEISDAADAIELEKVLKSLGVTILD